MFRLSKLLYICVLLLFGLLLSCERKTDQYEVFGKLDNVENGHFYVSHEVGDSIVVDTIPINAKGEFSFRGKVDTLTVMSMYFNENTKNTFVLVAKGLKVQVEGDVNLPDLIRMKGGEVNDDLTEFKNQNKDLLLARENALDQLEEKDEEKNFTDIKKYTEELQSTNFELSNIAEEYIRKHPEKIASVLLLNAFFKGEGTVSRLDENLRYMRGKAVDFPMIDELKRFRDQVRGSSVQSRAPAFTLKNLKEKEIKMEDFKGKYVLLSFVSTNCGVCRTELAEAIKVYDKLKKEKKGIEFVSIVKDIELKPVAGNITDSLKWDVLTVEGGWAAKTFDDYYVREIPYNILVDPFGTILERDIPVLTVPEKLDKLIGKVEK